MSAQLLKLPPHAKDNVTLETPTSGTAILDPSRSALIVIDMQNFFLHPALAPNSKAREMIARMRETIVASRERGMRIIWLNWGLTDGDVLNMPPILLQTFSSGTVDTTFGCDMGSGFGRKLMLHERNTQTYDELYDLQQQGIADGTDVLIHKNRLSGLWDRQGPLAMYLQEQKLCSLFFTGVNTDACVYDTLTAAYHQGFDIFLIKDLCSTPHPEYTVQMVLYKRGWVTDSSDFILALKEDQHEDDAGSSLNAVSDDNGIVHFTRASVYQ